MGNEQSIVADFVRSNRKAMAGYVRQKLVAAGAKPHLDRLGKEGIESLENEAAGVLLDLACAFLRRLHPEQEIQAEDLLAKLPADVQKTIRLPRSDAYHELMAKLQREE